MFIKQIATKFATHKTIEKISRKDELLQLNKVQHVQVSDTTCDATKNFSSSHKILNTVLQFLYWDLCCFLNSLICVQDLFHLLFQQDYNSEYLRI